MVFCRWRWWCWGGVVLDLGGGGVGVEGILDFDICVSVNVFSASATGAFISRADRSVEVSRLSWAELPVLCDCLL